ncbi:hypothetical protein Hanom_Chr10g00889181 [Helianthus anomalus]
MRQWIKLIYDICYMYMCFVGIYSPNAYRQFVWEFINDPAIFRLLPNFASFCWRDQLF